MIPPCDPAVLQSNPLFNSLYQQLTTSLLNPDGSTRANDTQPARMATVEVRALGNQDLKLGLLTNAQELRNCRIRSAKKQIKKQTLRQLAFDSESGLPDRVSSVPGSAYNLTDTLL